MGTEPDKTMKCFGFCIVSSAIDNADQSYGVYFYVQCIESMHI